MTYPNFDPVALSIGSVDIRWYGISYVIGIFGAWWICLQVIQKRWSSIKHDSLNDFFPWATLGIILGGRLGHALFYEFDYYKNHLIEILMIWRPGMSFHGGLLGVIALAIIYCRYHRVRFLQLSDLISVGAPFGFFFGRIANFINGELWGRVSDLPWAMIFPDAGPLPRHPSQLYEAILEGLVLLIIQLSVSRWAASAKKPSSNNNKVPHHGACLSLEGFAAGTFLFFYGLFRFIVEFVREPVDGFIGPFTAGQFYTLPMIMLGMYFVISRIRTWSSK